MCDSIFFHNHRFSHYALIINYTVAGNMCINILEISLENLEIYLSIWLDCWFCSNFFSHSTALILVLCSYWGP